jgi:hypothetical protein
LFSTETVYVFASAFATLAKLSVDEVAPATIPVVELHSYESAPPPLALATMLEEIGCPAQELLLEGAVKTVGAAPMVNTALLLVIEYPQLLDTFTL